MVQGQRGGYGHRRRRRGISRWLERSGVRRPLLGLGVTGAGMAAVALAVMVGIGQASGSPACAAVLTANAQAAQGAQAAGTVSGIATHYVLQGLPNCSYPNPPADQLFVALSPAEYDNAGGCGGYLEVTGPDGSVRVKVIDQCPECATGHIDLSEPAFAQLAPLPAGLINVHYTYLTDPALPGPISIQVKDGSSQYWLALLADNTGNPLTSVAVQTSAGWQSLQQANYNYWIAQSGAGSGPFTVRLTDNQGNVATVSGITLTPGTTQVTGTYMYGAGSAPAPAPSTPASSAAPASPAPAAAPATSVQPSPPSSEAAAAGSSPAGPTAPASPSASLSASPPATRPGPRATRQQPRVQAATASLPAISQVVPVPLASSTC
jgi:expansin